MPGFFLNTSGKKRKLAKTLSSTNHSSKAEVQSDSEESVASGNDELNVESCHSDDETAQEKRLRIAKKYINHLEQIEKEKQFDRDFDRDAIAHRLQQDVLEDAGRFQKFIADKVTPDLENITQLKGHQLSITCVVISSDNRHIFSASKDGAIIKWDRCTCEKICKIAGSTKQTTRKCHYGKVLCLALSTDYKYLASGGHDTFIHIWNPESLDWLHTFKGHRDHISSLAFQQKKHQLFSASHDKTLKVWSLDEMAYVETLFGHEDCVLGVDSLNKDVAVSCGGRDRSVRLWKIPEESQLVFQSSKGSSFDCVTMLNEEYFLAGGDDGSLSVFFFRKKKPITLRTNAHKPAVSCNSNFNVACDESWITAVTCLPFTDLVASGSCDGCIKLWRCEKSFQSIMPIHSIKMAGFVNSLKFSSDGKYLVAGVGMEHRLGRWWKFKEAKNIVYVIPIIISEG